MSTFPSVHTGLSARIWVRVGSVVISLAATALLVATLSARYYHSSFSSLLLVLVLAALCTAIGLHIHFLTLMRRDHRATANTLDATEREFKSIFDSALDAIFILDDHGSCLQANPAAERLLGRTRPGMTRSSSGNPRPGGDQFGEIWKEILSHRSEHSETHLKRNSGETIYIEYSARFEYAPGRHIAILRDVSRRKIAEEQNARNLMLAQLARAEADALRETTLALTQNLSMDYVLDTLLQSLVKLVPAETASVMLCETDTRLFLAREIQNYEPGWQPPAASETIDATETPFLMKVIESKNAFFVSDTAREQDWTRFTSHVHLRSWLCVPLIAADQVLGLLSLGHTESNAFTAEHLRLAKSLAIPAAVAIQNARLYERASIYGIELEQRLAELNKAQQALRKAEAGRT